MEMSHGEKGGTEEIDRLEGLLQQYREWGEACLKADSTHVLTTTLTILERSWWGGCPMAAEREEESPEGRASLPPYLHLDDIEE
ncbi:hypothetical protein KIPB_009798, partial [Kipferlia bialata]|eukprot:g9798.t1